MDSPSVTDSGDRRGLDPGRLERIAPHSESFGFEAVCTLEHISLYVGNLDPSATSSRRPMNARSIEERRPHRDQLRQDPARAPRMEEGNVAPAVGAAG